MNLMVARLCLSAAFVPVAITLHAEQILCDLSRFDAPRFIRIALPYATLPSVRVCNHHSHGGDGFSASAMASVGVKAQSQGSLGESPQVRLLALHTITAAIKHMESAQLLIELPYIVDAVIPSLASALVDMRKAAVFVLVNSYLIIGDALQPFVKDLPVAQKKILTFYIDKQMLKNSNSNSPMRDGH